MRRPMEVGTAIYEPNGDDLLFTFLNYRGVLTSMLTRIVDRADIDDIIQETYLRSFEAATRRRIRHPKSFMYRTARNLALNAVARSGHRLNDCFEDHTCLPLCPIELSVRPAHESDERYNLFCEAVAELPVRCRQAFVLKKVQGLGQREIAQRMGISESTVEQHVAKGLLACARHLAAGGYAITSRSG